jgi:hypothetical protein
VPAKCRGVQGCELERRRPDMARYGISERPDMAWHSTSVEIMSAYCECEWLTVLNSSVETARA